MTKQEAIKQLQLGNKITHLTFLFDEFIQFIDGVLFDENGYNLNWNEFWKYRNEPQFDEGWEIVN